VTAVADACDWPIAVWQKPIPADELRVAEARFGDEQSDLTTGAAVNDPALLGTTMQRNPSHLGSYCQPGPSGS